MRITGKIRVKIDQDMRILIKLAVQEEGENDTSSSSDSGMADNQRRRISVPDVASATGRFKN